MGNLKILLHLITGYIQSQIYRKKAFGNGRILHLLHEIIAEQRPVIEQIQESFLVVTGRYNIIRHKVFSAASDTSRCSVFREYFLHP